MCDRAAYSRGVTPLRTSANVIHDAPPPRVASRGVFGADVAPGLHPRRRAARCPGHSGHRGRLGHPDGRRARAHRRDRAHRRRPRARRAAVGRSGCPRRRRAGRRPRPLPHPGPQRHACPLRRGVGAWAVPGHRSHRRAHPVGRTAHAWFSRRRPERRTGRTRHPHGGAHHRGVAAAGVRRRHRHRGTRDRPRQPRRRPHRAGAACRRIRLHQGVQQRARGGLRGHRRRGAPPRDPGGGARALRGGPRWRPRGGSGQHRTPARVHLAPRARGGSGPARPRPAFAHARLGRTGIRRGSRRSPSGPAKPARGTYRRSRSV